MRMHTHTCTNTVESLALNASFVRLQQALGIQIVTIPPVLVVTSLTRSHAGVEATLTDPLLPESFSSSCV